jgi:DNA polymerase-3 subunit epsilon
MNEFIAIDFETGNLSPDSAISIGLVKYKNFEEIDSFYSLIKPPKLYIRQDFTAIHGLTIDDVKDADDFAFLWADKIKEFIGNSLLAAHYAVFDMKVLKSLLEYYGIPIPKLKHFCTCILSRKAWPGLQYHSLTFLANHFNIIYDAHNAVEDAKTCGKIVQLAAEKFQKDNIIDLLKVSGTRRKNL